MFPTDGTLVFINLPRALITYQTPQYSCAILSTRLD